MYLFIIVFNSIYHTDPHISAYVLNDLNDPKVF